jgi:drug/metabolite transporter (DMT)-like permease
MLIVVSTALRTLALLSAALKKGYSLAEIYKEPLSAVGSGFFQAVSVFGIIASLRYIPGPVMITIVFTHTLMLLVLLVIRGQAQLTALSVGTSIMALVGISLVVDLTGNLDRVEWRGVTLALIAAFATASRMYAYGNHVKITASEIVGTRAFTCATGFLLLLVAWDTPHPPTSLQGYIWMVAACISLMAGTVFSFKALEVLGSFRTSLVLKVEPVCTCVYSWLILNELLKGSQYLGVALVLGSVAFYQYRDR